MQGNLAMRAAIFKRKYLPAVAAIEHNGITREAPGQGLADFEFIGPRERVPLVGMRANAAQIDRVSRWLRAQGR
jgi:hypothetical protein